MYVSLFFKFVTFCSLQDRENAECLVFIHFGSQIDLKANPRSNTPHGQAKRRQITLKIKKKRSPSFGPPHNQPFPLHPEMACTVLSLSPSRPFWTSRKGKNGVSTVSFPENCCFFFETGWDFCFQHVCLACSIWCQFVNFSLLSLLSSNTRLRETWRAV